MRKTLAVRVTLFALMTVLLPARMQAQSFNGSIAGKVTDTTGAVVAGADLTLKNVGGGVEIKRRSTDAGEYAFRNLVPGTYELRASSAGFRPFVQKSIEVTMNGDVRLDVALTVGGQTE